jgi:uncharacterized protein (TIGR02099 family)
MQQLFRKILKSLAYVAAALVILLAVAVGLFRLLLPRLPEYQEELKGWADAAIGMHVEFADMNARWRVTGPELTFQGAELTVHGAESSLISAGEVGVGVSLIHLFKDRELVVDRIHIRDSRLTLQWSEKDGWLVQGLPIGEIVRTRKVEQDHTDSFEVIAKDIVIDYLLPDSSDTVSFELDNLEIARDDKRLLIDSAIVLPGSMGGRLKFGAVQRTSEAELGIWEFYVEGKGLSIPGWTALDQQRFPQFRSGSLELSASVQRSSAGIDHATADFALVGLEGMEVSDAVELDLQGRLEYSKDDNGWLLAASNFVASTDDGVWPRSTLSLEIGSGDDGKIHGLSMSASYLKLGDWRYIAEWLPGKIRAQLAEYDPTGVLRDLQLDLDAVQTDEPVFALISELDETGVAATESLPGVRNLSGLVRTDNNGGRLEIESADLILDLASQLDEAISFDDAIGTVIWRRNAEGVIILSDSVRIRNADMDSQSSLQVNLPSGSNAPTVDFNSTWSVNDLAAVKRYLPAKLIKPALYRWLSDALVAGNAPRGTLRLSGPMDKFPFDDGEGIFRIEARFENTTLRYSDLWPDSKNMSLDVVVDGMRLYSHRNSSSNEGNSIVDAKIEIPDLRRPVLSIDAFATGSLESIQKFSQNSPIARVFGGYLAKTRVEGDASFGLQLTYPILDRENYQFTTRIQTNGGALSFSGFPPQLTELHGIVVVTRDGVSSESLFGQFLGEQVNIELRSAGDAAPGYSIIAEATGRLTDVGLIRELAPPLENIIKGSSGYKASFRFPRGGMEKPAPFQIVIESGLEGMSIDLPPPLQKTADSKMPLSFSIGFPEEGRISAIGSLSDKLNWTLAFIRSEEAGWDFDRGALAVGGDYPEQPEVRGLQIAGEVDGVVLDDWLAAGRTGSSNLGVADRIRSIDLAVGNLHIIGQDLKNHRFEVQRGAQDWLVTVGGEQANGTVTVPYDFTSGRSLVIDMATLFLPGADEGLAASGQEEKPADPRNAPPLSITVQDFALGERFFGKLKAEFLSTERGLEATSLITSDASFSVEGVAGWVIDPTDETGQRTYINAKLKSTDIKATMNRLNYQPGIAGDDLEIDLDISWPGGPTEDFLASIDGEVGLRLGAGTLDDVEPGAGRVFGLMSVVALPRRLSLDFSDVFEKGFGFDSITGTFRVAGGQAYTCNLSLEGPAADVGIVGRTGLATRDYDQTAIVSANVGNTLPIIAVVVASPQVAAALLIFSQIFKKPLQEVGQIYYGIDGSWDAPDVAVADVARFASNSGAAGCLDDTQQN